VNQAEYQRLRRQLDEELRAGLEMLQAGHRAKVEALDARWEAEVEAEPAGGRALPEPAASPRPQAAPSELPAPSAASAPSPSARVRLGAGELLADVEAALAEVGEEFQQRDLRRALGYEPHRGSLHRALLELQREGVLEILSPGFGRRANVYRKTGKISPA
jgi:hypothetical protein